MLFPYGIFVTKKQLRKNIREDYPDLDPIMTARIVDEMFNTNYCLTVEKQENISFHLTSDFEEDDEFIFEFNPKTNEITVTHNDTTPDEEKVVRVFVTKLIRITAYTIEYLNQPVTEDETETATPSSNRHNRNNNNNRNNDNVIYINKKKYKRKSESNREYERHTESWQVRGHWRHYRDEEGNVVKKVWIEPHTRGPGKKKNLRDKTYKIKEE